MSKQVKTPAQLERDARGRDEDAHLRHVAALQAELRRSKALSAVSMRERVAKWGPSLVDLMLAIDGALEAADPLRGAPIEDVSRVSNPSSGHDEGASTRDARRRMGRYQRDLATFAARLAQTFGVELPDRRDFSAHVRWHVNREMPSKSCRYCREVAA